MNLNVKKLIVLIIVIALLSFCSLPISQAGGYKNYMDRSLTTTLQMNTDLSDEEIKHLVGLPRLPDLTPTPSGNISINGEWFMLNEEETAGAHFNGCEGKVIFDLTGK